MNFQKIYPKILFTHFLLFILLFLINLSGTGQEIKGFLIDKSLNSFDVVDLTTSNAWLKKVSATFVCNGKEYNTAALKSEGISLKGSSGTFGKAKTLVWKFSEPKDLLSFGIELTSYDNSDWLTVNGWVENLSGKRITVNTIRLLDTPNGFQLGGNPDKWRVLSGSTDNLIWTGEALKQPGSEIKSRLIMGLWNSETNQEAVIGFSIKHAWGEVFLKKHENGLGISAQAEFDVDLAPKKSDMAKQFIWHWVR
jgi:hypothetical protein